MYYTGYLWGNCGRIFSFLAWDDASESEESQDIGEGTHSGDIGDGTHSGRFSHRVPGDMSQRFELHFPLFSKILI